MKITYDLKRQLNGSWLGWIYAGPDGVENEHTCVLGFSFANMSEAAADQQALHLLTYVASMWHAAEAQTGATLERLRAEIRAKRAGRRN